MKPDQSIQNPTNNTSQTAQPPPQSHTSPLPLLLIIFGVLGLLGSSFMSLGLFFATQQLATLYKEFNSKTPNLYLIYSCLFLLMLMPLLSIVTGSYLKKKQRAIPLSPRQKTLGILMFIFHILTFIAVIPIVYMSIINPIYNFITDLENNSQQTTTFPLVSQSSNSGIQRVIIQDNYYFEITLPPGHLYKENRGGDGLGDILDSNGKSIITFLISSGGGELGPRGDVVIDGVPFTIQYRENIGCNADLYAEKAKFSTTKLYFQIWTERCKSNEEWDKEKVDPVMDQIIRSIKFSPPFKEVLLGKEPPELQ